MDVLPPDVPEESGVSRYGLDPEKEFLAGYLDGLRVGRRAILNTVRGELARFRCAVDLDGNVELRDAVPEVAQLPLQEPDNPLGDSDYEDGWRQGWKESEAGMVSRLREQLEPRGLFVADDGTVASIEVASKLVSWYRRAATSGTKTELTDAALHAFIDQAIASEQRVDRDLDVPPTPGAITKATPYEDLASPAAELEDASEVPVAVTEPEAAFDSVPASEPARRRRFDRRTALVSTLGALAGGGLTLLGMRTFKTPRTQSSPTWVPPTHWDGLPQAFKDLMLTIDHWVFSLEQVSQPSPVLMSVVTQIMSVQGYNDVKKLALVYLDDTQRVAYVPAILAGLDVNLSSVRVRNEIIGAVFSWRMALGPSAIPSGVRTTLEQFRQGGGETDPINIGLLDRLIPLLPQ